MASASNYLEQEVLDHVFGLDTFTAPGDVYLALFTAAPSDSGGGTEVSGNAYARVELTNDSTTWQRTDSVVSNKIAITTAAPTGAAWGTVTHWGLFDAATSGNLLFHGALTNARATSAGNALNFAIGEFTTTAD